MADQTVTIKHENDSKDESGVAAIVKAFVKNPTGAIQIIAFIGGMYGIYYTIQNEITDTRADSLRHYEQLNVKIDALIASDNEEKTKIEAIYTRGDTRYAAIITKLSSHDIDIARIGAGMDFVVSQFKAGRDVEAPHFVPSGRSAVP